MLVVIVSIAALVWLLPSRLLSSVSLLNRTAERRGWQNAWVWQTWRGYYSRTRFPRFIYKITSYADFLRRSPKKVCMGGYKRGYFRRSKPGCHGLLRVLDSGSLLAKASFLCYSEPLLAGKTVGMVPWEVKRKKKHRRWWNGLEGSKRITLAFGLWWWFQRGNFVGVPVTLELTVTTMLFCFSDMIHSLNRVEEILVKIPLDKEKQL